MAHVVCATTDAVVKAAIIKSAAMAIASRRIINLYSRKSGRRLRGSLGPQRIVRANGRKVPKVAIRDSFGPPLEDS